MINLRLEEYVDKENDLFAFLEEKKAMCLGLRPQNGFAFFTGFQCDRK